MGYHSADDVVVRSGELSRYVRRHIDLFDVDAGHCVDQWNWNQEFF